MAEEVLNYDELATIEAVLPLSIADYKKTFTDHDSKQFDNLLLKSKSKVFLHRYDVNKDPEINLSKGGMSADEKINEAKEEAIKDIKIDLESVDNIKEFINLMLNLMNSC